MNTTLMTILSLLVISGFFLFYSRNGMSGELGPDRQVIQQLNKAGSNIGKPHHIEFFFYFPTLAAAERIADTLTKEGFAARAERAATGEDYVVLASKTMVPAESMLTQLRKKFDAMSAGEHGDYDGWGTEIVK